MNEIMVQRKTKFNNFLPVYKKNFYFKCKVELNNLKLFINHKFPFFEMNI